MSKWLKRAQVETEVCATMIVCNSMESTFDRAAILIGSQRNPLAAVAHCPVESFLKGATVKEIQLTQGKVALVDDEDYDRLNAFKWIAHKAGERWYAYRSVRKRLTPLHQEIIPIAPGHVPDHKDGNGLNNQRSNLRSATRSQNGQNRYRQRNNTSGYRGVWFNRIARKWQGSIRCQYEKVHLGMFETAEAAARAYNQKARELYGEHAWLNPLPEEKRNAK